MSGDIKFYTTSKQKESLVAAYHELVNKRKINIEYFH